MRSHSPDYSFISILFILIVIGMIVLLSASFVLGKTRFDNPFHYFKHQLFYGFAIGLVGFFSASFIYYRFWEKIAIPLFLLSLILMFLVFTPLGIETLGARRWIQIGSLPSFQPSEFFKIASAIYLALWISKRNKKINNWKEGVIPFVVFMGIVSLPLILQKSTSSLVIIMAVLGIMYFLSNVKFSRVLVIILSAFVFFGILVFIGGYQIDRIQSFFNPEQDLLGRDYHINQSLIAIGSGGIKGVGFGQAVSKYNYLPEPIGDSIFAVLSQEFGFVGVVILISLYFVLFYKGIMIAKNSPDMFSKILVAGIISYVAIQSFVNIGAMSRLLPLTGQPLPFLSYGSTNLIVLLTSMGIIVNISKYTKNG
jgi:cell division protein FtsW